MVPGVVFLWIGPGPSDCTMTYRTIVDHPCQDNVPGSPPHVGHLFVFCNVAATFFSTTACWGWHNVSSRTSVVGCWMSDQPMWASLLCGRDVSWVYPCDNGLLCSSSKQRLKGEIQYKFYSMAFHLQFFLPDLVLSHVSSDTSSIPPAIKLETGS